MDAAAPKRIAAFATTVSRNKYEDSKHLKNTLFRIPKFSEPSLDQLDEIFQIIGLNSEFCQFDLGLSRAIYCMY